LVLAVIFLLSGFVPVLAQNGCDGVGFICVGVGVALLFLLFYLLSRQRTLQISSAGAPINFVVGGQLKMGEVRDFVDETERAKNERYLSGRVLVGKRTIP